MSSLSWNPWLAVISTVLIVISRLYLLKRFLWSAPLNHGTGFFLGVEVPQGFYDGIGRNWLTHYHRALLAELSIEAALLLAIPALSSRLLFPWWVILPIWAIIGGLILAIITSGFVTYTRATLGANPPVRSSFAIPLESRRLGDYISWPLEALMAMVLALSWALLIRHHWGGDWRPPVLLTYLIIGFLPLKVEHIRAHVPVPTENSEAHSQWIDARWRLFLRMIDFFRWMFIFLIVDFALLHTWRPWRIHGPGAWLRWSAVGVVWVIAIIAAIDLYRTQVRIASMGSGLRPVSSWRTPFRPAKSMYGLTPWSVTWFVGLILLLVFLPH